MQVYSFHPSTGFYVGTTIADESPLEPGVWLMPAHTTETRPPAFDVQMERARWTGEAWTVEPLPVGPPDLPVDPPPPLVLTRIFKADIWRRTTDAEAAIIDGALQAQPVRMRRLWDDSQWLETTDELYPTLEAAFVAAFGAKRAAELLAPSA